MKVIRAMRYLGHGQETRRSDRALQSLRPPLAAARAHYAAAVPEMQNEILESRPGPQGPPRPTREACATAQLTAIHKLRSWGCRMKGPQDRPDKLPLTRADVEIILEIERKRAA